MNAGDVRSRLAGLSSQLKDLHVKSLSLFGSAARNEAKPDSDLDFLVEFDQPATLHGYMSLKELLEAEFGVKIDLVTVKALKPILRDRILNEAVRVA